MLVDRALVAEELNICVVSARRSFAYGEAFCGELALGSRNREVGDKVGGNEACSGRLQSDGTMAKWAIICTCIALKEE